MLLRPGEVQGTFPGVVQGTAQPAGSLGTSLLPPAGLPSDCGPLPHTSVRYQPVRGTDDRAQHSTHVSSREGTCIPMNSHMYVQHTLYTSHSYIYIKTHVHELTFTHTSSSTPMHSAWAGNPPALVPWEHSLPTHSPRQSWGYARVRHSSGGRNPKALLLCPLQERQASATH